LAGDEILATFADNKDMNAYKFNTTVQKGGMIFFPFHNGLLSPEVEVTVVPQYNFPKPKDDENKPAKGRLSQLFSQSRGIWKDYAIDGAKLRNDAWGIDNASEL